MSRNLGPIYPMGEAACNGFFGKSIVRNNVLGIIFLTYLRYLK